MERIDWSIIDQNDWFTTQNMMFTYSEAEQEENKIAKNNSKLPLKPKFIPLYPELLWNWYSIMEALLFGFIDFFLSNNPWFYCTNEQLAELFSCNEKTISTAMKNLEERWDIKIHKKPKAWWGLIRFVTLEVGKKVIFENVKKWFSKIQKLPWIYNKIINNNKDIDKSISLREEEKKDKKEYKIYWEFEHIKLTDEQYEKLRREIWWWVRDLIEECDRWLELHPKKKYKNYYAFVKNRYKNNQKRKQNELEIKQKLYNTNKSKYKNSYNSRNLDIESAKQRNQEKIQQQFLSNNYDNNESNQDWAINRRREIWGNRIFQELE